MKKLTTLILMCCTVKAYTQDTAQVMKQIDSTVFVINHSSLFSTRRDSTVTNLPELKLYMKTFVTTVIDGKELRKFVNSGYTKTEEKSVEKTLVTSNTFYYNDGHLIKVEEYGAKDSAHEATFEWYYLNDHVFYNRTEPQADTKEKKDKLEQRGKLLLAMAAELKKDKEGKIPKI